MTDARLHALHWAFFVDVMDMEFADVYTMFSAWCESIPPDELTKIMVQGDALFGDESPYDDDHADESDADDDLLEPLVYPQLDDGIGVAFADIDDDVDLDDDDDTVDGDQPDTLYTEEEIWSDLSSNADISLN
mgnify:CR=1 FL=1